MKQSYRLQANILFLLLMLAMASCTAGSSDSGPHPFYNNRAERERIDQKAREQGVPSLTYHEFRIYSPDGHGYN